MGEIKRDILQQSDNMIRHYERFSYEEIASLVGTTITNVKVKVHRARIKLREILKAGGLS